MKLTIGPGALVAAAFIGPGTVTACTLAGAQFGFALVWALVFATLATLVLQDMAARLGAGARRGLGEAVMDAAPGRFAKALAGGLVFAALAIGNAAYEAGNLAGGVLGLEAILGDGMRPVLILSLAAVAAAVLLVGRYRPIEQVLIGLVMLMSLAFLISAMIVRPDPTALADGLVPSLPKGATLTAIALIGTTIVPYNLFLHAAAARARFSGPEAARQARTDSAISVSLGGLISILILVTAASALAGEGQPITSAADMARAIEPVFGSLARYLIGFGLFAAGLTSAITAPMATAYALTELFGVTAPARRRQVFRIVALAILVIGTAIALIGIRPVALILIAQAANGLLLPIVAAFLLLVMNRKAELGPAANGALANLAGWAVVVVTILLGLRGIARALGLDL